ncbi:hypothetical protein SAMN03159417_00376 [Ralstonia sp. NFACC01]|nr:hypothetical protein SAMN03159417_00376 [Ralstonia sp. NFACC01]
MYGHPRAVSDFVSVVDLDLETDLDPHQLRGRVYELVKRHPAASKATGEPLVCTTREISKALSINVLKGMIPLEAEIVRARDLCSLQATDGSPLICRLLNKCDLSLKNATAHYISQWDHHQLGRPEVLAWLEQFGALGKFRWIGEAILRSLRIIDANELGQGFASVFNGMDGELCVNRDARRHGKSGDTIATLITKRSNRIVHESPATAIDQHGKRKIILFEDGLWSGTEAMGVIESLQGKRQGKEKTRALQDPACLSEVEFTFAYGVATDYGQSVVRRFIHDVGLNGIFTVVAAETVSVASDKLLSDIESGLLPLDEIRRIGPPLSELRPYINKELIKDSSVPAAQQQEAATFCSEVGRQLFAAYLEGMQKTANWDPWPEEKVATCGLGMNGLGMVHAFSHSVPKATLPLIWGNGLVEWKGRHVNWRPLLPNA